MLELARGGVVDAIHVQYARIHPENVEAGDMLPTDSLFFAQGLADECLQEARAAARGYVLAAVSECTISAVTPAPGAKLMIVVEARRFAPTTWVANNRAPPNRAPA